jgi:hypothetical protein
MTRTCLVTALVILAGQIPASGHHSFAAHYFEDQSVSIEGEMVAFEYRNPHAWVHVLAPDAQGEMRKYGAEWSSPNRLRDQRIHVDTLRPGDLLKITGSPGRNADEYRLHLKAIERPADGWRWKQRGRADQR